ncbi:MAG: hypothetical protein HY912_05980 [Desulfomonile tiedjei]|uniref:Uncharacterized protein n=1 Tax=Desulfomonile tiedjei TaxID=2358 RepID=A0A9D6V2Y4_9BACT|nr:hypothetical protein [Desulfomonile tiedjei]
MRNFTAVSLFAILILTASVSAVDAQVAPSGIVDSSLRMEFLFGTQALSYSDAASASFSSVVFRADFNPRVPLLAGTVEVSPFPSISGRFAGAVSIMEKSGSVYRANGFSSTTTIPTFFAGRWDVEPDVGYWELAGLYHLWNGGGYRFSCTAGYRREVWRYHGESVGNIDGGTFRDDMTSQIPFLGLQTSMFFPLWKARFEVLGSAFMNKKVASRLQYGSSFIDYRGTINQGGLLEFQMEGNVSVTQNLWCGLHAKYTYQELTGDVTADTSIGQSSLDLHSADNYITLG